MKNLKLLFRKKLRVESHAKFFTNNPEASKFFIANETTVDGYDGENMCKLFSVDLTDSKFCIDATNLSIVGLQYMYGEEQVCIAMRHGEIALLSVFDLSVESTGMFDCEIQSMVWSPDQEIVLLVTNRGSVVMLSHDFDPLQEIEIEAEHFGDGDFINVGWGSKETQFQGSAGKFVAGKTDQAEKCAFTIDDQQTKAVWRGDGQYFAISHFAENHRSVRIWNRDGELQYTGEKLSGLESSLAWKPSGSLIASTQRKVQRHDIVFFELNGLQHGEFTLPFETKQMNVKSLAWNSDSTVLMVVAEETTPGLNKTCVQLWYSTNYHWSLKKHLEYTEKLNCASWDSEQPHSLHVLLDSGWYCYYNWAWEIDRDTEIIDLSRSSDTCDSSSALSYVAVVDRNLIKLTPFKTMSVPPPMCAYQLKIKNFVHAVFFCQSGDQQIGVLDNKGQLLTFRQDTKNVVSQHGSVELVCAGGNGFSNTTTPLQFSSMYSLNHETNLFDLQTMRHMVWTKDDMFITSATKNDDGCDYILFLKLQEDTIKIQHEVKVDGFVVAITPYLDENQCLQIVIQNNRGTIFHCSADDGSPTQHSKQFGNIQLPSICSKQAVSTFGTNSVEVSLGLLCLSLEKQLFLNGVLINSECTSFAVHDKFILITTSSHKLISIPRETSLSQLLNAPLTTNLALPNSTSVSELSRSVERGSTIVTLTSSDTKVVLQMPRGNLEVIHPRPLVLTVLKVHLSSGEYRQAFMIMRKHRINMNLFHDHNPDQFYKDISQFIEQLGSSDYLNIFLSDLLEEDVTSTLYKQYYNTTPENTSTSLLVKKSSKVDKICDLVMEKIACSEIYLTSGLTAHVRKSKPEIDSALIKVKQLKDDNNPLAAGALKHLHVMVDARVLYREALATYDLELALMVAQASNEDPKEYIPFLNELKGLEQNYMKYKIDMFLKKFPCALHNIAKCEEHFQECIELVTTHELYREAIKVFGKYTEQHREICKLYAEFLAEKHRYEEAGLILFRCNLHKRALKCFVEGCYWEHALSCAVFLKYSEQDYIGLACTLADRLSEQNRHIEAANVYVTEAKNVHSGLSALIKAQKWANALQLLYKNKLNDAVDSLVVPALKTAANAMTTSLHSHRENFDRYFNRLIKVRELKREKHLKMLMTGADEYVESDIASDFGSTITTSSQGSRSSRMSGRSAKTRRKHQRNKFSLREGSRYEEEGLLQALQSLIKQCFLMKEDLHSVVAHLALFHFDEEATALQRLYSTTIELFNTFIPKIWTFPSKQFGESNSESSVTNFLELMVDGCQESFKLSDLEVFIPPKVDSKVTIGLHLYT